MAEKIDAIDLQILEILQARGRTKRNELADRVDLSIPAVSERLRKLEEAGIIRGFHAVLNPLKVGLDITAFIFVGSESSVHYPEIIKRAAKHPEVLECHAITGEGSHLLKVRTKNTGTLERLLSEIQSWPGVSNTRTNIVLSTSKETSNVSLKQLSES